MKIISLSIEKEEIAKMDTLVENELYRSRSEMIRLALRDYFKKNLEIDTIFF